MSAENPKFERCKFWMVWREGSPTTRFRHQFKQSAVEEAERLSRQNPNEVFYVLKSTAAVVAEPATVKHLKLVQDAIPF